MATNETPAGDPVPKLDSSNVVDFCNNSNSILMLPGVPKSDIHSIDDIIYSQFGIPNNYFIDNPTDLSETRIDIKMDFYRLVDYLLRMCMRLWEIPDQVWLTYFKLLHYSSESDFKDMGLKIIDILPRLMSSRDVNLICNAIKFIRTITSRSKDLFTNYFNEKFDEHHFLIYLECKLSVIPEAFDEKDRRITSWISSQSKLVTEYLMTQHGYNTHGGFLYLHELTTEYIKSRSGISKIFDVFVTTKKENFHKFVDYFIGEVTTDMINSYSKTTRYYQHAIEINNIITEFVFLYIGVSDPIRNWSETDYKAIANCIGFNIDSYLSGYVDEAMEMNCIKNYYDEGNGDYTIIKFLMFDDFVRRIQLINIFHKKYLAREKIEKFVRQENDEIIEKHHDLVECYRLLFVHAMSDDNPRHRNLFTWCFKCLMKLCPRVFLAPALIRINEGDNTMESLLDVLNNKDVSRAIKEKLYFSLCYTLCRGV